MNDMISLHWLALIIGIALTGISQLLLRSGAEAGNIGIRVFVNYRVILGYGLFFLVTLLNMYALQVISFKILTAWASLTYVITPILASIFLKDKITRYTLLSSLLIVIGIVVFMLAPL